MTNEQIQCLLKYLGYYKGPIDGIIGKQTEEATRYFQRDFTGLEVDGKPGAKTQQALKHSVAYGIPEKDNTGTGSFWDEIEYFEREEFACPCPRCGGFPAEPGETVVKIVDKTRKHFGKPGDVSSGVRCQAHNDELPGSAKNSRHIGGKAVDFRIRGNTAATTIKYVKTLPGVRYAYEIDSEYVHVDTD